MIYTKLLNKVSTQIRCWNSPLPILIVICLVGVMQNVIYSSHQYVISYIRAFLISILFIFMVFLIISWFNLLSFNNNNFSFTFSRRVLLSYHFGFLLFLVSEFMLFFWLFWSFFHYSWIPSVNIGASWPSYGIEVIDWKGLSFFNTCILISSSLILNWVEWNIIIITKRIYILIGLINVILWGLLFLIAQYVEYSKLPFAIRDSVYSNIFYAITGLHLSHVLLGILLLTIVFIKGLKNTS